jgi:hypothetical protein
MIKRVRVFCFQVKRTAQAIMMLMITRKMKNSETKYHVEKTCEFTVKQESCQTWNRYHIVGCPGNYPWFAIGGVTYYKVALAKPRRCWLS